MSIVDMQGARDGKRSDMRRAGVRNAVVIGAVVLVGLLAGEVEAAVRNPDGVAVIIGNRAYEYDVPQVAYAHRDAAAFRRYVVDVLGFDPENVIYSEDADKATMERVFGNRDSLKGSELWRYLHQDGISDVVVFYSGHGIPGLNDKRGYLLPVNAHPDAAELNGYPIDVLYQNLIKLKEQQAVRSVRVFLDACFSGDSGGGRLIGSTSAIRVAPLKKLAGLDKLTILTAASGKEVASWDKDAKHGLFTHHLLNALYGEGDVDADGQVTAAEAKAYLDRHMTRAARRTFGRVQNADLRGKATAVLARAVGGMFPVRPLIGPVRRVGERFRDCPSCPEMVVVPAGSYEMGSPISEAGRYNREGPVHRVTIAKPFAVGVYEITRGEFQQFVEATGYPAGNSCLTFEEGKPEWHSGRHWRDPGFAQTDQHPVVCVSWQDAQAYVQWLSQETGQGYRLLSEAEWEYAARAGTRTAWYWGQKASGQCVYANGADKTWERRWGVKLSGIDCDDGYAFTSPVGVYGANAFGLHDVLGNVSEWVQDCWHASYDGAPSDGRAWESGDCSQRMVRGGSWLSLPELVRPAYRNRSNPGGRDLTSGFRLARTLIGGTAMPQAGSQQQEVKARQQAEKARPGAESRKSLRQVGERFRDCPTCPEMVVVPAGSYEMGSPASEVGRLDREGPVHRVTIAKPFAVGVYEITRGEFQQFVEATGYPAGNSCMDFTFEEGSVEWRSGRHWRDPGFAQTDQHPVVCVSWQEAQAYVRWLSQETGQEYRLLSEAEWEYVARAGTRTARYWGEKASGLCAYANGADKTLVRRWGVKLPGIDCDDGYAFTSPVGVYGANAFGLHDVLGNSFEWVQDCWNDSYAGAPVDGKAWESGDCSRRVWRGGSWYYYPEFVRPALRYWYYPGDRLINNGFRLARTLAS